MQIPNYIADQIGPLNVLVPAAILVAILPLAWIAINSTAGILIFCILYGYVVLLNFHQLQISLLTFPLQILQWYDPSSPTSSNIHYGAFSIGTRCTTRNATFLLGHRISHRDTNRRSLAEKRVAGTASVLRLSVNSVCCTAFRGPDGEDGMDSESSSLDISLKIPSLRLRTVHGLTCIQSR